jgi:hypothetical protein
LSLFFLALTAIAILTAIGPAERTLGANARIVYLHGVWVWASLAGFVAAGLVGLAGLFTRNETLHRWSRALGRTALFFWITYLPISMWAMQTSWNGLFLAEPRFRMALILGVTGLLLQLGVTLLEKPAWTSLANVIYGVVLFVVLANTQNVMHPPSPILASNAPRIQMFFGLLFLFTLLAAWQVARWWYCLDRQATGMLQLARPIRPGC